MIDIKNLFDITKKEPLQCSFFLPHVAPPLPNSKEAEKDIDSVVFYYANPCLRDGFLDSSHNSVKNIFKKYCEESGHKVDWKKIKKMLGLVKNVSGDLKNKFKRPRPKEVLIDQSQRYNDIHDMESYSYPSGHTSSAYFIANILGSQFPDSKSDLENIAALIGQSRIENGVHYPSDISYGRLVGECCADYLIDQKNENYSLDKYRKRKDNKKFGMFLRSLDSNMNKTSKSIANFLYNTLQIENLQNLITYRECLEAARKLMTGVSDKHLSDNPLIKSQCMGLRESYYLKSFTPESCIRIHKQMTKDDLDKGIPGEFRNFSHYSPAGVQYCSPDLLYSSLKKLKSCNDPILRHALFEWVHPFFDGNGRTGRIILCSDMNYDFSSVNSIITKNYIENLNRFYLNNNIEDYFG